MRTRSLWFVAGACLALAGCNDDDIAAPRLTPRPGGPQQVRYFGQQPAEWRGYWRDANTLWVYDVTPEVGISSIPPDGQRFEVIRNQLGMRFIRLAVAWNKYLAQPNCYVGNEYSCGLKFAAEAAAASHLKQQLVVVIENDDCASAPCLYVGSGGVMTASRSQWNQAFAGFVAGLARQYPTIRFWQAWNEPDAGYHGIPYFADHAEVCPGGSSQIARTQQGGRYREFLRVVYDSIQNLNAQTGNRRWLLTAGMTGGVPGSLNHDGTEFGTPCPGRSETPFQFVHAMYNSGAKEDFDFLAIHAYGRDVWEPGGVAGKSTTVTSILSQHADDNRPVWVTEFGSEALSYSDRGRLLDPGQRHLWRDQFDAGQLAYYQGTVNYQTSSRAIAKTIAYHLAADDGGQFVGPTGSYWDSFGPAYGDTDFRSYGVGIFRADPATGLEQLNNPRPSASYLIGRAATNSLPHQWDEQGGTEAPFSISTFSTIPNDVPFQYTGTNPTVLSIGPVNVLTMHPTEVKFFTPVVLTPYVRNVGWMYSVYNNMVAGYETETRTMDMLQVQKVDNIPGMPNLCVQAHSSVIGWGGWQCGGAAVGAAGYQMEALQMTFDAASPWTVCYQVHSRHAAAFGWSNWGCDGETAGTVGQAIPIGAVRVRIHRKPDRSYGS